MQSIRNNTHRSRTIKPDTSPSEHMDHNNFRLKPLQLRSGMRFQGPVTQSGILLDGGYRFDALQRCTVEFTKVNERFVECDVHRDEVLKFINGIGIDSPAIGGSIPSWLYAYLRERGSSVEHARGTFDSFTGVLLLKGYNVTTTKYSEVIWSPHFYSLVADGDNMIGTAHCLNNFEDRENAVGSVELAMMAN